MAAIRRTLLPLKQAPVGALPTGADGHRPGRRCPARRTINQFCDD